MFLPNDMLRVSNQLDTTVIPNAMTRNLQKAGLPELEVLRVGCMTLGGLGCCWCHHHHHCTTTTATTATIFSLQAKQLGDFIVQMLTVDPASRPSATQLLQHKWLVDSCHGTGKPAD
jgi:serine/threonine protein kinase